MTVLISYLASALVLGTFCTRTMVPLRIIALGSNCAFIAYGALEQLYPVLLLHIILLPVNTWRLIEIRRLIRSIRGAISSDDVFNALVPFAKRLTFRRGEVIMRKGDLSDALYLVMEGWVLVEGPAIELGPGSIVGEMGVLSGTRLRTATVGAKTDCVLARVSAEDFQRVYYTNPSLGFSLIRLIIDRLTREMRPESVTGGALPA